MLSVAAIKQLPTRYAQNKCHGIHAGTSEAITFVIVKCSVPKPASGAAYKSGPSRINLSSRCALCQWPYRKIVSSPMAKTPPPTEYDQITWLGMTRKANRGDE